MTKWSILLALVLVTGCAHVSDRVVLLRGALDVKTDKGETELTAPYDTAEVKRGTPAPGKSSADDVRSRYGALLQAQPPRPRSFVVYFIFSKTELTAESKVLLKWITTAIADVPAVDVIVIGHTDTVGPSSVNDDLSLLRAKAVRDALVNIGVPSKKIAVIGRGERQLAVRTADGVPEPRNRRAEINIR